MAPLLTELHPCSLNCIVANWMAPLLTEVHCCSLTCIVAHWTTPLLIEQHCCSKKFWRGWAVRVFATIPLAMETEGQNRTLGYGKWVKIKTLTIGNVTKLTTFEAILHDSQIAQILSFALEKKGAIRSKFAENIPLATEPQPKLNLGYGNLAKTRPLAMEFGLKRDPCGRHPRPWGLDLWLILSISTMACWQLKLWKIVKISWSWYIFIFHCCIHSFITSSMSITLASLS